MTSYTELDLADLIDESRLKAYRLDKHAAEIRAMRRSIEVAETGIDRLASTIRLGISEGISERVKPEERVLITETGYRRLSQHPFETALP